MTSSVRALLDQITRRAQRLHATSTGAALTVADDALAIRAYERAVS